MLRPPSITDNPKRSKREKKTTPKSDHKERKITDMFQRQHQKNMKTTTTVTKNSLKSRKTENLEKDMSVGVHVSKASEMQDKM